MNTVTTEYVNDNYIERHLLDVETYRRFAKHNAFRWLLAVAQEWATIALAIYVCVYFDKWWLYPFAIFLIGYVWEVPAKTWLHVAMVLLYQGIAAFIGWKLGHPWIYFLLWLLPLFSVALMCFRIRTVAEHSAIGKPEDRYTRELPDTIATTRTTIGG